MGIMQDNQTDLSVHTLESTTLIIGSGNMRLPVTITLKSSAAGKALTISTDGGNEFFTPVIDTTTATMLVLIINAPVTHIKATGAINDTLTVGQ